MNKVLIIDDDKELCTLIESTKPPAMLGRMV